MSRTIMFLLLLSVLLTGCVPSGSICVTTSPTTLPEQTTEASPSEATEVLSTMEPEPAKSEFHISGVSQDEVLRYFNEVCLDAEFVHSGDPSRLQKWDVPIRYSLFGTPTEEDLAVLKGFADWLNTIEGFPGMAEAEEAWQANLRIHFCSQEERISLMGEQFLGMDGAVTFWYDGLGAIYDGIICIRTDLEQHLRNSVILEELYNGLGPVQDTWLREDSIIYAGYSEPQCLTEIDELLLQLLYHPSMQCGMNTDQCEAVIREIYN